MADKSVTDLTATTALASGDLFYVVDGSNSRKVDWDDVITQAIADGSLQVEPSEGGFADGDKTKLDGIDTGAIADIVSDTTPQLGGDLDVNGNSIVSASDGDIDITPNGTGNVTLGNFAFNADQTVGAGQDDYVLTYDDATGLINLEASAGGGGSPGGSDTQVQYNNSGSFGGSSKFTFNDTNGVIEVNNQASAGPTIRLRNTTNGKVEIGRNYDGVANIDGTCTVDSEGAFLFHSGDNLNSGSADTWIKREEAGVLEFKSAYGAIDRSTDPGDPPSGQHAIWQSDGTGSGDDGDIMIKVTDSGGTTKTITLVDYSAF